ncbi:c-type cytochrome [Enterovibrio paralichthyis]|uniref:c-type cytochrome n=1 Tax=Enterovibrio paralichthyis TaxID=2853805 RepID=UPI001C47DA1B|nr:c-type cytochrome [Enterovibrio paralichthyis]MBV7300200.1 c-type cytochrome [Enterovibrio paralichthyis]
MKKSAITFGILMASVLNFTFCTPVLAAEDALFTQGKALYENPGRGGCMQCHGATGNEPVIPLYPKIGGQSEMYLNNQLMDYKNKKRQNGLYVPMEVAMQPFSAEEIKAMALYLARQDSF